MVVALEEYPEISIPRENYYGNVSRKETVADKAGNIAHTA